MSKEGERQFPAVAKLRYHRQNDEELETLRNSDIISPHPPIINHFCVKILMCFHSNYMTLSIRNKTDQRLRRLTLMLPSQVRQYLAASLTGRQVDAHAERCGLGWDPWLMLPSVANDKNFPLVVVPDSKWQRA